MARARRELAWDTTSALMAVVANAHRAKGKPVILPSQFNPMRAKPRQSAGPALAALAASNARIVQISTLVTEPPPRKT